MLRIAFVFYLEYICNFFVFNKSMDENTPYNEPSFVGLLFPNFSTIFWIVTIQCGLLQINQSLSYELLSFYSTSSILRTDQHLAMLEAFRKNHRPLAEVSWQGTTPYYVHTFRLKLANTHAYFYFKFLHRSKNEFWFIDGFRQWFASSSVIF